MTSILRQISILSMGNVIAMIVGMLQASAFRLTKASMATVVVFATFVIQPNAVKAYQGPTPFQQVTPWEYDPYRAVVWMSIDPVIRAAPMEQERLIERIAEEMEIAFGGAFSTKVMLTPDFLRQSVQSDLKRLTVDELLSNEMVLVLRKDHPQANSIRTLEAALKQLDQIAVPSIKYDNILASLAPYRTDEVWESFASKLTKFEATSEEFLEAIRSGKVSSGMIAKTEFEKLGKEARQVVVRLPWQVDSMLRAKDKLFFVSVTKSGEGFACRVRELDCPMKVFGEELEFYSTEWSMIPRAIGHGILDSFTPVARIEETEIKRAKVKVRASGLVAQPNHPVLLTPGDVLMPYLRKNDRNGNPTLLQTIPWTYIALTHGDQVNLDGSVFSGMRGALTGRQNRRTIRVAMKVKPRLNESSLRLGMRNEAKSAAAGIAVYRRTPSDTNLDLLGRSDWRGIFKLSPIAPPEIEYELPEPKKELSQEDGPVAEATTEAMAENNASATSGNPQNPAQASKDKPKGKIALKVPLHLYYVRNGDTVLARLPVVVGLNALEAADLPDDSRRLEAEALLKGLQGEIIDAVARRQILISRINAKMESKNVPEAKKLFEELRQVKNYDRMAGDLESIQRKISSPERGTIAPTSRIKIDAMFNTTRQMMQKYLQDAVVRDIEVRLAEFN